MNYVAGNHPKLALADRIWHLSQAALVNDLSGQDLLAIGSLCKDQVYPQGATLFRQGDRATHLYILNRGYVELSVATSKSSAGEKVLGILKGGDVFGEEIAGAVSRRQTTARAYEECWVSIISRNDVLELMRMRHVFAANLIRILSRELFEARDELKDSSDLDVKSRVAKALLKLGRQHGSPALGRKGFHKLRIEVSHRRLAALIGANRPHVSSIMSHYRKLGCLRYQNRRLLINLSELKRELSRP